MLADTDLRQRVLPDALTLPLVLTGLLFRSVAGDLVGAVFGLAGGAGLLTVIASIAHALYAQEVLGWGMSSSPRPWAPGWAGGMRWLAS